MNPMIGGQGEPPRPGLRSRAEPGGPLVGGGRGGVSTAITGPYGGALQFGGHLLVGACRRHGQMPGAPVGVVGPVQRLGQGLVYGQAQTGRDSLIDGGPDQGMPEGHGPRVDQDQSRSLRRVQILKEVSEAGRGPQHHIQVAGVLGRGHRQQPLRRLGQHPDLAEEGILDPAGERQRRTVGRRRGGQFDQRERVASRLGQQAVTDGGIDGDAGACGGVQQRRRGGDVQPLHRQLRYSRRGERLTCGEDQYDAFGVQPPRGEQQRVGRGPVQPLRVVHQHQQRAVLGQLRQQGEHRQADQQPVARLHGGEAEGGAQRPFLMLGQRSHLVEYRPQQ